MKKINIIALWILLGIFLLSIDIFIKNYIQSRYSLGQIENVTNFFNITNVHNYGAAFSLLNSFSGWQNYLLIIFALVIIFIIGKNFWNNYKNNVLSIFLIFIISGAIGNMWDRIYYKYVIDYVHFHFYNYSFPVFNFADILIFIGAIGLLIINFKK